MKRSIAAVLSVVLALMTLPWPVFAAVEIAAPKSVTRGGYLLGVLVTPQNLETIAGHLMAFDRKPGAAWIWPSSRKQYPPVVAALYDERPLLEEAARHIYADYSAGGKRRPEQFLPTAPRAALIAFVGEALPGKPSRF